MPKAQFVVAFDQGATRSPFHGVYKIAFDVSDYDRTLLNERLAYAFMRVLGLSAPCANSAELYVNGAPYGVFTTEESYGQTLRAQLSRGRRPATFRSS